MRIHPVRPTSAVRMATTLHLTQIEVRALRLRVPAIEIMYLFGRIPATSRGLPDFSSHRSRYVLVSELSGRFQPGPRLFRDGTGRGRFYWEYQGNFVCHTLTLTVDSNLPAVTVRRVGAAIRRLEACPPGK